VPVRIIEETDYPFRDQIGLSIDPESPVSFELQLRIPAWAQGAIVLVNGKALGDVKTGTFQRIQREWKKGDRLELTFPMVPRVSRWYNGSIAIERGPLVFSLKIGEDWRKLRDKSPAADWEVYPTTAWNYALQIDSTHPEKSIEVVERELGKTVFTPDGAALELHVKGRRLPQWTLVHESAAPPPPSPVSSPEAEETLTLIPYGCAKLRITAFPQLAH
jgi:glycosyl hydrolase family 127 (putative beta-L-arabinofuranosidase)